MNGLNLFSSDHGISGIMPLDTCPTFVPFVNTCLFEWVKMFGPNFKNRLWPSGTNNRIIKYSDPSLLISMVNSYSGTTYSYTDIKMDGD